MAAARVRAVSTLRAALRPGAKSSARSQVSRMTQAGQRRWQSGHGSEHTSSSDIPWAIGALAVSIPGTYYLWPSDHRADAGRHGAHGEEHHEDESESNAKDSQDTESSKDVTPSDKSGKDESSDDSEQQQDGKNDDDSEKAESKDDDDSAKAESKDDDADKSDSKDSDQGGDDSGKDMGGDDSRGSKYANNPAGKDAPQFKGKMKEDAEGQKDIRKSEPQPPSKGTNKKRIDSGAQKQLGTEEQAAEGATAKLGGKEGKHDSILDKQYGLSNTATRHSTQIDMDETKSKKSEGVPETAKSQTAIDPDRPAK